MFSGLSADVADKVFYMVLGISQGESQFLLREVLAMLLLLLPLLFQGSLLLLQYYLISHLGRVRLQKFGNHRMCSHG